MKNYVIAGIVALVIISVVLLSLDSKEEREYKKLVRIANRQSVEIAVIEQAYKLAELKSKINQAKQAATPVMPQIPKIADPKDIGE